MPLMPSVRQHKNHLPRRSPNRQYNVRMRFDWEAVTAVANARKHKVTFEAAKSVFYDEFAVQFFDEEHSSMEDRFLLLGMSSDSSLLLVCQCEREDGEVIRIISARKATEREAKFLSRWLA